MAKGYGQAKKKVDSPSRNGKKEYVTSKGIVITLHSMPPLIVTRVAETITFPDKPTYTIKLESGDEEVHDHDKTTLVSPEDRSAWEKYITEYSAAESETTYKILRAVLMEGVDVEIPDEQLIRWKKRQELMGIPVSEDFEEMLIHYKETEIIGGKEDMQDILNEVMKLSGITEEALKVARRSFPNTVESDARGGEGEGSGEPKPQEG